MNLLNTNRYFFIVTVSLLAAAVGCKKKPESEPEPVPIPESRSSSDISTNIGNGLAIDARKAPTSTKWERAIVLGPRHAILFGHALDKNIALSTKDGGKTWRAKQTKRGAWTRWGAANDDTVVLASSTSKSDAPGKKQTSPIVDPAVWIATSESQVFRGPFSAFADDKTPRSRALQVDRQSTPVPLSNKLVSLSAKQGNRTVLTYVNTGGDPPAPPLALTGGTFAAVPYGQPPQLLAVAGRTIQVRPWPQPGETLAVAAKVPNFAAGPRTVSSLNADTRCDAEGWSFQQLPDARNRPHIVGISASRLLAFPVPQNDYKAFSCLSDAIVLQSTEAKTGMPHLVRCAMDGKCSEPKSKPFELWTEQHQRTVEAIPTEKGIVAVMSAKAGARWGVYLAQSLDNGETFELPRVIGEGTTEQGNYVVGALIGLPKRLLLLLSGEVAGGPRRGWFLLASDDAGSSWGPP